MASRKRWQHCVCRRLRAPFSPHRRPRRDGRSSGNHRWSRGGESHNRRDGKGRKLRTNIHYATLPDPSCAMMPGSGRRCGTHPASIQCGPPPLAGPTCGPGAGRSSPPPPPRRDDPADAGNSALMIRAILTSGSISDPSSLEPFPKPDTSGATKTGHTSCYGHDDVARSCAMGWGKP